MKQNNMGVATLTNYRPGPTPREEWSDQHAEALERGDIVDVLVPWDEAKALGLLRRLDPKNQPRCLHLRPGAARLIEDEQRHGGSPGPAIGRLIERGDFPRGFHTSQCQTKALQNGEGWVVGGAKAVAAIAERQDRADAARVRQQFRKLLRR